MLSQNNGEMSSMVRDFLATQGQSTLSDFEQLHQMTLQFLTEAPTTLASA
jgi:hypothetical protein